MKIAAATNDGCAIAAEFDDASYYAVLTVEEGLVVRRELREKKPQGWYSAQGHAEHRGPRAAAPEAVRRYDTLADPIRDCDVVLVSGIDAPSRGHLEALEIWPIVVDPGPIDAAVQALLAGTMVRR